MQQAPSRRRNAWAKAKVALLDYWDNPPATLFWILLTLATVGALKVAGL